MSYSKLKAQIYNMYHEKKVKLNKKRDNLFLVQTVITIFALPSVSLKTTERKNYGKV